MQVFVFFSVEKRHKNHDKWALCGVLSEENRTFECGFPEVLQTPGI